MWVDNILCLQQLLEPVCPIMNHNYKYVIHKMAMHVHYRDIFSIKVIKLVPRGFSLFSCDTEFLVLSLSDVWKLKRSELPV